MFAIYSGVAFTVSGSTPSVAANATIEVRLEDTGALASIFSDEDATTPITNPSAFADSNGRFQFYAAGLDRGYSVQVTKDAFTYTLHNQAVGKAAQLDYEEGPWTPTLSFGGASVGLTYFLQLGKYKKIGKQVFCEFLITVNDNGSSTGDANIGGFPFAASLSVIDSQVMRPLTWSAFTGTFVHVSGVLASSTTQMYLVGATAAAAAGPGGDTIIDHTHITNSASVAGSFTYSID